MSQPLTAPVPPARPDTKDAALDRLLHPSRFYERPRDVLNDKALSNAEKRAILSSWASDACAVESCPALRHPYFAARPVGFDDVMSALAELDSSDVFERLGHDGASRSATPGTLVYV